MKRWSSVFSLLVGFNILVWGTIAVHLSGTAWLRLYFFDVGQGDSQLISLPEGGKILIDSGPGKEASFQLAKALQPIDRYVDLVVLTHAEKDHLGGLKDILSRHRIGVFLWNGDNAESDIWLELKNTLAKENIPAVQIGTGDRIIQGESTVYIVSPDKTFLDSPDKNERSLVILLASEGIKALFTGDIGMETERTLLDKYDLDADILKVAHHGSRFSTSAEFLDEVSPAVAVIEVGENTYGHPHPATLQRLAMAGVSPYRTDTHGTVSLSIQTGKIGVRTERWGKRSN